MAKVFIYTEINPSWEKECFYVTFGSNLVLQFESSGPGSLIYLKAGYVTAKTISSKLINKEIYQYPYRMEFCWYPEDRYEAAGVIQMYLALVDAFKGPKLEGKNLIYNGTDAIEYISGDTQHDVWIFQNLFQVTREENGDYKIAQPMDPPYFEPDKKFLRVASQGWWS